MTPSNPALPGSAGAIGAALSGWEPWSESVIASARSSDRPIVLFLMDPLDGESVSLAREVLADPEVVAAVEAAWVPICVDRGERTDLWRVYEAVHPLLTGRGAPLPLLALLEPRELGVIFSSGPLPRTETDSQPGLADVLRRTAEAFADSRETIERQSGAIQAALAQIEGADGGVADPGGPGATQPDRERLESVLRTFRAGVPALYDDQFGGFGGTPRYLQPSLLERLMTDYERSRAGTSLDRSALHMVCHTLRRMALGGIHDPVEGGFFHCAYDKYWMTPRLEKRLGENARLLSLLVRVFQATGDSFYQRVAEETADYLLHGLQAPEGGFETGEAADPDRPGGPWLYTRDVVLAAAADGPDRVLLTSRFGLDESDTGQARFPLHVHASFSELATGLRESRERVVARWQRIRQRLREARAEQAVPVLRDHRIGVTDNALAIRALVQAGREFGRGDWLAAARRAAERLDGPLSSRDGGLIATGIVDGVPMETPAFLDDAASLVLAARALAELDDADTRYWQRRAVALGEWLHETFADPQAGGVYRHAQDAHGTPLVVLRPFLDGERPSGNALVVHAFLALAEATGEPAWASRCDAVLQAALQRMDDAPFGHGVLLDGVAARLDQAG